MHLLAVALLSTLMGCGLIFDNSPETHRELPIDKGADDADETPGDGAVTLDGSHLAFGMTEGSIKTLVGLRFVSLGIPKDTKISKAYIQFTASAPGLLEAKFDIGLENSSISFPPPFSTADRNISERSPNTILVPWIAYPWLSSGDAGIHQQTSDLSQLIEVAVAQDKWGDESSLVLIFNEVQIQAPDEVNISGRQAHSWEGAEMNETEPPTLHVFY